MKGEGFVLRRVEGVGILDREKNMCSVFEVGKNWGCLKNYKDIILVGV